VAATLLGATPDKVAVETFGASNDLSDLLFAQLDHIRDTMGLRVKERPYLNGDAFKVSVKGSVSKGATKLGIPLGDD
jgi:hypothetical protein